jgi:hypothetical protein
MALQETDEFFVSRPTGADAGNYKASAQQIKDLTLDGGFTGDVVIDGVTLAFTNGLLTAVS